jgi:SAM-dependent methyltransferase
MLGSDDLGGLDVLDLGAGRGLYACAMASLGARSVMALEPESHGAQPGAASILEANAKRLGLPGLRVVRSHVEELALEPASLDCILLKAVINHLDEKHVQTLHCSPASHARFLELLRPLATLLRPGGRLIAYDAARNHALSLLVRIGVLSRDPRFPTIEWHKHQDPCIWRKVLLEAGFREVHSRWFCHTRYRGLREFTANRRWVAWWIAPHFVLTAIR